MKRQRCVFSAGAAFATRQCPETATHERRYKDGTRSACCYDHRFPVGHDETTISFDIVRLTHVPECAVETCHRAVEEAGNICDEHDEVIEDNLRINLGDEAVKLCFAPPPEIPGQPSFVIREPEIAVPTLLLLLEMAECQLYVKATITCDEVFRMDDDRCAVCRMKDTVKEHVTIPERASSSTLSEVE